MGSKMFFELRVKEDRGRFSPTIDVCKGDAKTVIGFIKNKYLSRKNVFEWFAEPFNVIDQHYRDDKDE